jgi:hypothetical protein
VSDNEKIVPFRLVQSAPAEPDADLIAVLEALLERAKAGELAAIAYAAVDKEHSLATGWEGISGTRYSIATALAILHHRYTRALLEG